MTDNVVSFGSRKPTGGGDGYGTFLRTVYLYENGHVIHYPEDQLPPDFAETQRLLFKLLWEEAAQTFRQTGDEGEEVILLVAISTNGRVRTISDADRFDTLERNFWARRMLQRVGEEDLPAFRVTYHNDNHATETIK